MRFESNADEHKDTLPTFVQWCKANTDKTTPDKFIVTKIWLPNKFPDITLETETFRLRLSHKTAVFRGFQDYLDEWESSDTALFISEVEKESYSFTVEVSDTEKCSWEMLGETGRKLTIQERKKTRRKSKA